MKGRGALRESRDPQAPERSEERRVVPCDPSAPRAFTVLVVAVRFTNSTEKHLFNSHIYQPAISCGVVSEEWGYNRAKARQTSEASKVPRTKRIANEGIRAQAAARTPGPGGRDCGASIPEEIEVQGEDLDLQSFVFEIKRRDTVPKGERDRVETAKKNLRRERLQRRQLIENDEISFEEGEALVEDVVGIDRALNALEQLRAASIEGEAQAQEMADRKRWMKFLQRHWVTRRPTRALDGRAEDDEPKCRDGTPERSGDDERERGTHDDTE